VVIILFARHKIWYQASSASSYVSEHTRTKNSSAPSGSGSFACELVDPQSRLAEKVVSNAESENPSRQGATIAETHCKLNSIEHF
jgi:hypothetical protein